MAAKSVNSEVPGSSLSSVTILYGNSLYFTYILSNYGKSPATQTSVILVLQVRDWGSERVTCLRNRERMHMNNNEHTKMHTRLLSYHQGRNKYNKHPSIHTALSNTHNVASFRTIL